MANILLVDDDQAILDIVGLWLENEGHTVVKAHDGEIALSSLDDKKFDVMITDIIMPKTEGIELIREIRDQGRCVLFSSHIMSEVEALCDRIIVISDGVIVADGKPEELRQATGQGDLEEVFLAAVTKGAASSIGGDHA